MPEEAFFLDSTNTLSRVFSHLSVNDPDLSIENVDLVRVSSERDTYTEDDHKALDDAILTTFDANRVLNKEPHLHSLLSNITNNDIRLLPLTAEDAKKILENEPLMKVILKYTWQRGAFREVRRLCVFSYNHLSN